MVACVCLSLVVTAVHIGSVHVLLLLVLSSSSGWLDAFLLILGVTFATQVLALTVSIWPFYTMFSYPVMQCLQPSFHFLRVNLLDGMIFSLPILVRLHSFWSDEVFAFLCKCAIKCFSVQLNSSIQFNPHPMIDCTYMMFRSSVCISDRQFVNSN